MEIYEELDRHPNVRNAALERSLGSVRPDIFAEIKGVSVAFEVQLSNLSIETIIHRTREYERKGIYVLWLPQWTPALDGERYNPSLWEKWIHAAYFGHVYYWTQGLSVVEYRFDPHYRHVPKTSWYSPNGNMMPGGGYNRKSTRYRAPVRCEVLNVATDFGPYQRQWWQAGELEVPFAKLFLTPCPIHSANRQEFHASEGIDGITD